MEDLFNIDNFNIIEDEENYYFFRALNMADTQDIETGKTLDERGNIEKIRTDREKYEENPETEQPKYDKDDEISLEQVYDHIKMHYRKDTNCISLSSNSNVSISYGREFYKDRYVMVKVPKNELGKNVINAGQYMLEEIAKRVEEYIPTISDNNKILETLNEIDNSKTEEELRKAIETRYTSEELLDPSKAHPKKGITYKAPIARISSYQSLNEEQSLEKNKIIAKLTLLERVGKMEPIIPYTANNNLLVQTVGNAFSSLELIHYGDIQKDEIIEAPKEIVDIFALLQQVNGQNKQQVDDLKKEVLQFIEKGRKINIPEDNILLKEYKLQDNISIEEMYNLTDGKVEYGQTNSIVKNLFYLARSQSNAKELSNILDQITGNNPKYKEIIKYISDNGFRVEPNILTRQSNRGVKLSESVSLDLKGEETELINKIKSLSEAEQIEIMENGGLSNVRNIMSSTFAKTQRNERITKEEYYAEAIFSLYDWNKIGTEEFTIEERNNIIKQIQNEYCVELYHKLEEQGINIAEIPTVLLNMVTSSNDFEITKEDTPETIKAKRLKQYDKMLVENRENLKQDLSIARIERFLGYYDVQGTGIQLRPYQQRATEKVKEILQDNRFASVILPTGGGKSFVALSQMMEHKDEEMLYLAPQNEILEQLKDNIIEYIHGPINTIKRSKEEIIADIFPNLKFATYPSLLAREGKATINKEYGFIVLDELHRTGAQEWGERLNTLLDNQGENTKILGITATPRRDVDGINMANEIAQKLGYTNKEAVNGKHVAMNMSLTNAIRMGLVVNPKLVSCEYNLSKDGSLDELKERIDQIEDIQDKNEKLSKYESLRKNVENAEGIPEILQANVKKGGKYIVFLPIIDELEDEDGNVIGRKKGKEKIEYYEKQIAEYFEGSDLTLKFHSMLGEYGDKENARQLEEFQKSNTENTEIMLVMNKANEGLHIENLNGIIWLRPMDENSKILYLQQLGRVIYSEDPDKPTKDEDRPVVIDLVNNTLKVNWENEITEQEDIQILNNVVDWVEIHNGTLPNINSSDKEESGYATVLKEIQNKYKEYLENEFDDLNEKQIEEIQEIIRLGTKIDLWQIELPNKITKSIETQERGFTDKNIGPFELTGLLKDFVEIQDEVNESENKTAVEKFIHTLKQMQSIGADVSKIATMDTIETLAKKSGISREKLEEIGLEAGKKIGSQKDHIAQAYRGKGKCTPPTTEQVEELAKLGISLEKQERNAVQEFIDTLQQMQSIGVDVSKMIQKDTIETLAKKSGISIEKLEEIGLEPTQKIGSQKHSIAQAYRGKGDCKPPDSNQVEELTKLGISLEKQDTVQKFIDTLKEMQSIGVNVSKMTKNDTIETLAKKSGISREKLEEIGLEPMQKIGSQKTSIAKANRRKGTCKPPSSNQEKELAKLGISLEAKRRTGKEIAEASISSLADIEMTDRENNALTELVEKAKKEEKV